MQKAQKKNQPKPNNHSSKGNDPENRIRNDGARPGKQPAPASRNFKLLPEKNVIQQIRNK